ncbi:ribosome assembly protein 4 [Zalerion maritima]|uniref:Ribosome assembly protein 4 n=1 Tax=Zalerion maritima TaxID=339359 RepID=A0AAD5WQA0_9PEZI|nr:ribosome assembly protein 4 [Zalerion maritima]
MDGGGGGGGGSSMPLSISVADSDRLSVNPPSTRVSSELSSLGPRSGHRSRSGSASELNSLIAGSEEINGSEFIPVPGSGSVGLSSHHSHEQHHDPNERPPAYTSSPDPSGPQPVIAPMPMISRPTRLADMKHPKLGEVFKIRYSPNPSQLLFITQVMDANGAWPFVRCLRIKTSSSHYFHPAREQALQFAISPDGNTCALAGSVSRDGSDYRTPDRKQLLEIKLFSLTMQGVPPQKAEASSPVFRKVRKLNLGLSRALDSCDDADDRILPFRPMAFSADGKILAVGVRGHRILLCSTGAIAASKTAVKKILWVHSAEVTNIVFSRERNRMASCSIDGVVRVTGQDGGCAGRVDLSGYQKGARRAVDLAISPQGDRVVSVWGSRVVVWLPDNGTVMAYDLWEKRLVDAEAWPLALSPDGRLLACRTAEGMDILDSNTSDVLLTIEQPEEVTAAAFSANGNVMTLGRADGYIETWRLY